MHTRRLIALFASSTLGLLFAAALLTWTAHSASGLAPQELHVCPGCQYQTIQAAVDAASPGALIKVAQGVYSAVSARHGISQVVYIEKPVTIGGGYPVNDWDHPDPTRFPTLLDATKLGRVVVISGTQNVTLIGLGITGGNATYFGGNPMCSDAGAGVYIFGSEYVTIRHTDIFSNTARKAGVYAGCGSGGGIFAWQTPHLTIEYSQVRSNIGHFEYHGHGGGAYIGNSNWLVIRHSIFRNNRANGANGNGGGLFLYYSDDAAIYGNAFFQNMASWGADALAGGTYIDNADRLVFDNNLVQGNIATQGGWGYGGGMYLYNSESTILRNNLFLDNIAVTYPTSTGSRGGGAIISFSDATLINNVFARNSGYTNGGGLLVWGGEAELKHTTFNGNLGAAVEATTPLYNQTPSHVELVNSIIVSHTVGISVGLDSAAEIDSTLWQNVTTDWTGPGIVTTTHDYVGSPLFLPDGFHLTANSAALNKGIDAGVTFDLEGDSRPASGGFDLGADEFWRRVNMPLVPRHY